MKSKVVLNDFTFLIIVRLDSISRLENILICSDFLVNNFLTEVHVMECAPYNNGLLNKVLNKKVKYSFLEDNDFIFHRTKLLNRMTTTVETQFVSVWDSDVIIPIDQIVKSANLLRNGGFDFVYPYEKRFLDSSAILRKLFIQEGKLEILEMNASKMKEMYLPVPVGGAFFANLKSYLEAGMENELYYGWGLEDGERLYRWENLGYKIQRVQGCLFHLTHEKGINSTFHNDDQKYLKRKLTLGTKIKKKFETPQK